MNPEEQEYYDIDESNRVLLRIIDKKEEELVIRGKHLGKSISQFVSQNTKETTFLELYVKELAQIQNTLGAFDRLRELDIEGYNIGGYLIAYLKHNNPTSEIKHLGEHSLNIWSVSAAYEKYIYEKYLVEVYKGILEEFNKKG
ncbi:hypothetical protein SALINJAH_16 [Bacillus phage SalinJah]|uniref:Uncharacterized protein n=1 Tax=Bacillus phage SalinJah TaxID=1837830 RepID=A0A173GBE0_9CAUD|nr:hypothetical protein SALINJAH_16 [Bacillus phage SalinJah]ANH50664.1 hypothetical protein SALINJAH_16 [Bacillus phage SalinJah]